MQPTLQNLSSSDFEALRAPSRNGGPLKMKIRSVSCGDLNDSSTYFFRKPFGRLTIHRLAVVRLKFDRLTFDQLTFE
jgi:hypothetical protein